MKPISFYGEVILPGGTWPRAFVHCDSSGRIAAIDAESPAAGIEVVEGRYVAPGYIDLHVHGGDGADYMDGTPEAVRIANRAHARHGTTTIFPTTTTGSLVSSALCQARCFWASVKPE